MVRDAASGGLNRDASVRESNSRCDGERPVELAGGGSIVGDALDVVQLIWVRRWLFLSVWTACVAIAVSYALFATEWFRGETVLVPAGPSTTQGLGQALGNLGGLSGLAGLAGISIGGGNDAEPLAVLKSKDFARAFIEDQKLMPILLHDSWDDATGRWRESPFSRPPDIRDAIRIFDEDLLSVAEDKKSGIVTVAIEWKDAALAAKWTNMLVDRVNERMRQRALHEAQENVKYLQAQLAQATVVVLQQSISQVLESELQKLMLAEGNREFSFRVVDRAEMPKKRARPRRGLVGALGILAGGLLGVFAVLLQSAIHERRRNLARRNAVVAARPEPSK